jgi:hypothetical protein
MRYPFPSPLTVPGRSADCQLVQHEIEAGNVLKVTPIPRQKTVRMLRRLASKPEILNGSGAADPRGKGFVPSEERASKQSCVERPEEIGPIDCWNCGQLPISTRRS